MDFTGVLTLLFDRLGSGFCHVHLATWSRTGSFLCHAGDLKRAEGSVICCTALYRARLDGIPHDFRFGVTEYGTWQVYMKHAAPVMFGYVQLCHMNLAHFLEHCCFICSRKMFSIGIFNRFCDQPLHLIYYFLQELERGCDQTYRRLMNAFSPFLPRDYPRFSLRASEDIGLTERIKETHANNKLLAHTCTVDAFHSRPGGVQAKRRDSL